VLTFVSNPPDIEAFIAAYRGPSKEEKQTHLRIADLEDDIENCGGIKASGRVSKEEEMDEDEEDEIIPEGLLLELPKAMGDGFRLEIARRDITVPCRDAPAQGYFSMFACEQTHKL
ncbi:hypothetical protein ACJX0J_033630, partial [Zea mays]